VTPLEPPDAAAVAAAFGLGRVLAGPDYAARGELGLVYRLATETGRWAVKQLLYQEPDDDPDANLAYQEALLAAGVPMPRPRRSLGGRAVEDGVRVYAWVDLEPGRRVDAFSAGRLLARIHRVRRPAAGPLHWWYTQPVAPERWTELIAGGRAADAPWAEPLAQAVPQLLACVPFISAPDPARLQLCHLDFNWENVLWTADGAPVVIDWENAGPGDPRQELAATLIEFGDPDETLRGYLEAGGDGTPLEPRDFSLAVAVHSHLIELYSSRWLEAPDGSEDRARNGRWLSELLPPLVTPRVVEAIVAGQRAR
jgi:Ser/Thr protein kinase RdoA (MazF antagonist)